MSNIIYSSLPQLSQELYPVHLGIIFKLIIIIIF